MPNNGLLQREIRNIIVQHPFFASILLHMNVQEDSSCDSLWVDGVNMGVNPSYLETRSFEDRITDIMRATLYVANLHHTRRQGRDQGMWSKACAYVVNDILKQSGRMLPKDAIHSIDYRDMSAEQVYSRLQQAQPQEGGQDSEGQSQGQDQGQGPGQGQDQGQNPGPGDGEVRDYPGEGEGKPSPGDTKEHEEKVKSMVVKAKATAKSRGKEDGAINQMVHDITNPALPWKEVLARFLEEIARNDYSWNLPNPRYIQQGIYLPKLYSQEYGSIALLVDVSGSINKKDVDRFAAEVLEILNSYTEMGQEAELLMVYVNTKVVGTQVVTSEQDLQFSSGGGTDFRPGFEYLEQKDIEPKAAIYFTDGECNRFPKQAPDYPVLWAGTHRRFNPPFGEVLLYEE